MKKGLLMPLLVLLLVTMACSFGAAPRITQNTRTPTSEADGQANPTATTPAKPTSTPDQEAAAGQPAGAGDSSGFVISGQPVELKGTFAYSNDIVTTYYVEHAVALIDMYGFVTRDQEWEMPIESQTLGYLAFDPTSHTGEFDLQLPARPEGTLVDVNPDPAKETGVQVFVLGYWPNLAGGPYSEGDDPSRGWASYLTSTVHDSENDDEVIGGKLIVWAPDGEQSFPSEFGADGLLFTEDDPVQAIPAGYSVIDLDQKPFAIERDESPEITLNEPKDIALKDYSDLSYSEAFNQMFEVIRKEYAFNGIEGKAPDWDALYDEISPKVKDAEEKKDADAFFLALRDFTLAFQDGHVGVSGGQILSQMFAEATAGGYGFAVRELDDGRVVVVFVTPESPAAEAGMEVGAEVTQFNGKDITEAIDEVVTWSGPYSTDFSERYQKGRYLTRAPLETQASVTFQNPEGSEKTVQLVAVAERDSFSYTSLFRGFNPYGPPVEYSILPQGIGYVKITTNYDDLNLIIRLFERALRTFSSNSIPSLIIDMRQNSGGANLGLAGFLYDREIPMGQLQYYSEATGKFEDEGLQDKVIPNVTQYPFQKMFLLVGPACASACELEAYAFSQVPGMEVVGQYPSSGTEGEVARGQFRLPEGYSLQVPTGRYILPDGSLFLEGTGVVPTKLVPITEETVLSGSDDPVLDYAINLAAPQE